MRPIKFFGTLIYKRINQPQPEDQALFYLTKETNQVDFAVLTDHRVKVKKVENLEKYLDLVKELKGCEKWGW